MQNKTNTTSPCGSFRDPHKFGARPVIALLINPRIIQADKRNNDTNKNIKCMKNYDNTSASPRFSLALSDGQAAPPAAPTYLKVFFWNKQTPAKHRGTVLRG